MIQPQMFAILGSIITVQTSLLETLVQTLVPEIIHLIELIGIFVITVGSIKAFVFFIFSVLKKSHYPIKLELGNALALGLEFKMGAEILKTVIIRTPEEIFILGAIIVLRALLSVLIHFEVKSEKEHGAHDITTSDY